MPMTRTTLIAWLRAGVYPFLALAVFAAVTGPFLRKADSQFDNVYLRAAQRLQTGEDIYPLRDGYLYPPLMAWMSIPLAQMPPSVARCVWLAINFASLAFLWIACWRLAGGKRLRDESDWREHLACWIGLAIAFRFGLDCLQNQQTDILIAALVVGGIALLQGTSRLSGGLAVFLAATCFGLAAGMKCTALLFAPYLLYRGRWLAAVWVAFLAVGLNLLPNLTSEPDSGGWWLGEWVHRYLAVLGRSDHSPGVWGSAVTLNQSWSGALYRWFATSWTWDAAGFQVIARTNAPTPTTLKWITYGSEAALVLLFAGLLGPRRLLPTDRGRLALECSIIMLLMVLLSPMSSKPHFVVLLLPAWLLARSAVRTRDPVLLTTLVASFASATLTIKDLATPNLASLGMWYGGVTWSTVLLLLGCGWTLIRDQRAAQMGAADRPFTGLTRQAA
jgi:hypothetical protein